MVEKEVKEAASLSAVAPLREPDAVALPATLEISSPVMVEWNVVHCSEK
jgi:hypothetical protein